MKSHSEQGYKILLNVKAFEVVADVVRSHHERYDGKGYPDGLKGTDIPLGSRIIAIADSIDAMICTIIVVAVAVVYTMMMNCKDTLTSVFLSNDVRISFVLILVIQLIQFCK